SPNANCAGACTPVSEPSRPPSGTTSRSPIHTPNPAHGPRPPTKSWPAWPDFVSELQRQDTSRVLKNYLDTLDTQDQNRAHMRSEGPTGCSKRPSSAAAASEEARRTLRRTLSL